MRTFRKVLPGLVLCLAVGACAQGGTADQTPGPTEGATVTNTPAQPTPSGADDLPVPPSSSKPAPGPTTVPGGPTKRPAGPTTLTGTVVAGVEPGCLMLDQYLLVGGAPAVLRAGARVKVTGRVEAGMVTTCQQGTPFVVETAEPA